MRKKDQKERKRSTNSVQVGGAEAKQKNGRWSMMEHVRFLEALKMHNKNWKKVEEHVATRTSTQARSHAQKFFANILKKNMTMEQFLENLSLETLNEIKNSAL
jgi:SHAQKYF class myb-like DNA-binding protein